MRRSSSELGAHRNVLQVRFGRGQAAGRRDHLLKMRVDAVVLRVRNGKQAVHIGALELGQAAVFQNVCNDGMVVAQALEHLCTRRIAGLGLFRSRQAEPLEQDFAQLTGAVQVELRAGIQIDLIHKYRGCAFPDVRRTCAAHRRADSAACVLHLREHPLERQLNFVIKLAHAEPARSYLASSRGRSRASRRDTAPQSGRSPRVRRAAKAPPDRPDRAREAFRSRRRARAAAGRSSTAPGR